MNLPEEQPAGDQTFISLTWWFLHDIEIWWVEAKSSSWQTVSNLNQNKFERYVTSHLQIIFKSSLTKFTHSSWTGIRASGRPRAAVKKMDTTSPMLEEIR